MASWKLALFLIFTFLSLSVNSEAFEIYPIEDNILVLAGAQTQDYNLTGDEFTQYDVPQITYGYSQCNEGQFILKFDVSGISNFSGSGVLRLYAFDNSGAFHPSSDHFIVYNATQVGNDWDHKDVTYNTRPSELSTAIPSIAFGPINTDFYYVHIPLTNIVIDNNKFSVIVKDVRASGKFPCSEWARIDTTNSESIEHKPCFSELGGECAGDLVPPTTTTTTTSTTTTLPPTTTTTQQTTTTTILETTTTTLPSVNQTNDTTTTTQETTTTTLPEITTTTIIIPITTTTVTEDNGGGNGDKKDKDDNDKEDDEGEGHCYTLCHVPLGYEENQDTICVGDESSIFDHLNHGDYPGKCSTEFIRPNSSKGSTPTTIHIEVPDRSARPGFIESIIELIRRFFSR